MTKDELIEHIGVLKKEIEVLTTRLKLHGTGHLHTAISVINGRIDELIGAAIDENPGQVRDLTSEIYGEDVYDGYKEHTEAMEQARLRKIQDSAAGRDGLSNRSIKQKHGQAVQTVSEMMQEELEPLPINTFE